MPNFVDNNSWVHGVLGLDWIEQCFTSAPTQYRLYGRRFLQVKRPNQQYQTTEGGSCKGNPPPKKTKKTQITHAYTHKIVDKYSVQLQYSKSPSLQLYGVTRGRLPQRAGLPGLNGGGAAAAVPHGVLGVLKTLPVELMHYRAKYGAVMSP